MRHTSTFAQLSSDMDIDNENAYGDPLTHYESDNTTEFDMRRIKRREKVNFLGISALASYRMQLLKMNNHKHALRRISLIIEMPNEIISEILGYLHPIDLLNISKMNLEISRVLQDEASHFVWKSAFGDFPDLPGIPQDVSGLRWADLLFSPHVCEQCGTGAARPNITFYKRLCHECNAKEFEIEAEEREEDGDELVFRFSDDPLDAHNLARRAKTIFFDPRNIYTTSVISRNMYSKAELNDIRLRTTQLKTAIDDKVPGAESTLERYKNERLAIIKETKHNNANAFRWATLCEQSKYNWARPHIDHLFANVATRFRRVGFLQQDVVNAHLDLDHKVLLPLVVINGVTRLTRKRWTQVRPLFEPAIETAKKLRHRCERARLIQRRTEFVKERCRIQQESWLPATWAYHPPFYVIQTFEPIQNLIHTPHNFDLLEDDVVNALSLLPKEVGDWHASKMKQLVSLIPASHEPPKTPTEGILPPQSNALGLATSVFHCLGSVQTAIRMGGCLIGWDDAGPHLRCRSLEFHWEKRLHFSQRGQDTATSLVRLVGLDHNTTTIWEMNSLDKRFVCMKCPLVRGYARRVYEWPEAVYHGILTENDETHRKISWRLLGPEAEADLKCREDPDPYIWEKNWICNHCPQHFENRVTRRDAINHVQECHDISRPANNLDYLYFAGRRKPRPSVYLPVLERREVACLRCASTKCKLYLIKTISSHLRNAHRVVAPVAGEDWEKIAIFAPLVHPDSNLIAVDGSDDQLGSGFPD